MGGFADMLKSDQSVFFGGDFDEPAVYLPAGNKPQRNIRCIVRRQPPAYLDASGNLVSPKLLISVANNVLGGISSAEVDARGADRIELPLRVGQAAESFALFVPASGGGAWHDLAILTLEAR